MNKKFTTLMALAIATSGAFAQTVVTNPQAAYRTFETINGAATQATNPVFAAGVNLNATLPLGGNSNEVALDNGSLFKKTIQFINGEEWYQLEIAKAAPGTTTPLEQLTDASNVDYVLIQERDYLTGKIYLRAMRKSEAKSNLGAPLNASLWKIVYTKADGVSGGKFTYINKETNMTLSFDHTVLNNTPEVVEELRDGVKEWSWYTINTDDVDFGFQRMYSYLHDQANNQVMYLALTTPGLPQVQKDLVTRGYKYGADWGYMVEPRIATSAAAGHDLENIADEALAFRPVVAMPFFMTAEQFNSRMDASNEGKGGVNATLDDLRGDTKGATFTINKSNVQGVDALLKKYTAIDVASAASPFTGWATLDLDQIYTLNNDGSWPSTATVSSFVPVDKHYNLVFKQDGKDLYLKTTATRYEEGKAPHKSPASMVVAEKADDAANNYVEARYVFRLTYFPTNDSLLIEPLNAGIQSDKEKNDKVAAANWQCNKSFVRSNYNKANTVINDEPYSYQYDGVTYNSKTVALGTSQINGLQEALTPLKDNLGEFVIKNSIDRPFAYLSRDTKATELYFINLANHTDRMRAKGMSLVMNMEGRLMYDTQALNQNYNTMPATMWTIEQEGCDKDNTLKKYVTIKNREYGEGEPVFYGQIYADKDGNTFTIDRRDMYMNDYSPASGQVYPVQKKIIDETTAFTGADYDYNFEQVDFLKIAKVTDPIAKSNRHGYKYFTDDELNDAVENNYNLYWNNFMNEVFLQSGLEELSYLTSEGTPCLYEIARAVRPLDKNNGIVTNSFGSVIEGYKALDREAYIIKVKDGNLIDNDWSYIGSVKAADGRYYYRAVKPTEINDQDVKLGVFYFKADQFTRELKEGSKDQYELKDTCYVLVDINAPAATATTWETSVIDENDENGWDKVAVEAGKGMGVLRDNNLNDMPNDVSDAWFYKHTVVEQYIDLTEDYKVALNGNVKMYQKLAEKNYFFEDGNDDNKVADKPLQVIDPEFHYLGIESKGLEYADRAAMYVEPVISAKHMPRYLFGLRVDSVADGVICNTFTHGYWANDDLPSAEEEDATHLMDYNGYTMGWYLINLNDSMSSVNANKYKLNDYTRLAFVKGVHQVTVNKKTKVASDTLFILRHGVEFEDLMKWGTKDEKFVINNTADPESYYHTQYVINPEKLKDAKLVASHPLTDDLNANTDETFSLRRIDEDYIQNEGTEEPFLLETSSSDKANFITSAWVKIENGIPVLAKQKTTTGHHETLAEQVINELIRQGQVYYFETTDDEATENEDVEVATVKVVAGEGQISIIGAAGKTVTIANILGQTVANTVISSDNATIAVPAGVVVVSVEGEEAVKAVVK